AEARRDLVIDDAENQQYEADDSVKRRRSPHDAPPLAPASRLNRALGEKQRNQNEAQEVDQIPGVDDAGNHLREMIRDGKVAQQIGNPSRAVDLRRPGNDIEDEQRAEAGNRRDDLVLRDRAGEEADRDEGQRQQPQPEVTRHHDADLGISEDDEDDGKDRGQSGHDQHEGGGREEFARDSFAGADRGRQQELVGAGAFFLGEGPHGDGRDQDDQHDGQIVQERLDDTLVEVHVL